LVARGDRITIHEVIEVIGLAEVTSLYDSTQNDLLRLLYGQQIHKVA